MLKKKVKAMNHLLCDFVLKCINGPMGSNPDWGDAGHFADLVSDPSSALLCAALDCRTPTSSVG